MKPAQKANRQTASKVSPPGRRFLDRVRRKRILETLAAFIGGGWLVVEFVDWVLINHYHFPEQVLDITLVTLVAVLLVFLLWRWFARPERAGKPVLPWILGAVIVLVALGLDLNIILHIGGAETAAHPSTPWKNSIAVLPFENISPDEGQDYFCNGLTVELITRLSNIQEFKVIAKTSAFAFKGKNEDVRDIGKKLGVANVLEGDVRKAGNKLRITSQLISVADGVHLWSAAYDREMIDIFAIQADIALAVADKLKGTLLGEEKARLAKSPTSDLNAYQLYLKGKYHRYEELPRDMLMARDYYEEAIRQDPNYAVAVAGLAEDYMILGLYSVLPRNEAAAKAKDAAQKALELDGELSEGYVSRGVIKMVYDLDWKGAEADFQKALALNPNNFDAYREYALLLLRTFRYSESEKAFLHGQAIDPLNLLLMRDLRTLYQCMGYDDKAEAITRQLIKSRPDWALGEKEYYDIAMIKGMIQTQGRYDVYLGRLAVAYAESGDKAEALKLIRELETKYDKGHDGNVALILATAFYQLGERGKALDWLELGLEKRGASICDISRCIYYKSLQKEPRYLAILKKIGVK